MARSLTELQIELKALDGVVEAYIQPPSVMSYPCIIIEQDSSEVRFADNIKYRFKKQYTIIVVDRDPLSPIPDLVEGFEYSKRMRRYIANGYYHFVFQLFY